MKIDEAIEILEENIRPPIQPYDNELANAVQLGIEALKRFKLYRKDIMPPGGKLLPGETEE